MSGLGGVNIPDEAVEAAMEQLPYQAAGLIDADTMRAALAAAIPHLMPAAYQVGWDAARKAIMSKAWWAL